MTGVNGIYGRHSFFATWRVEKSYFFPPRCVLYSEVCVVLSATSEEELPRPAKQTPRKFSKGFSRRWMGAGGYRRRVMCVNNFVL